MIREIAGQGIRNSVPESAGQKDQPHRRRGETEHLRRIREQIDRKEQIHEEYADVFKGMGLFPGAPYKLNIDESVRPVIHGPRSVPVHLLTEYEKQIKEMITMDVVEKITHHTPWVNSIVLNSKKREDGTVKLRICLDPTDLNKAI